VPVALASVALLGVAGIAFATRDGAPATPSTTGRLVRIDPASNRVADVVSIGNEPSAVAVAESGVWVADRESGRVARIDPATGRVELDASAHGKPVELAVTSGRAVVSNGPQDANVAVIDVPTGTDENVITLAKGGFFAGSARIAAGTSGIWVAGADRRVGRLDLNAGGLDDPVFLAPPADERSDAYFSGIAVADDAIWVVGDPLDRRLWRIDPETGDVAATISLPFAPKDVAVGEGGVWVTSQLDDTLSRVDPRTNDVTATVAVGRGASGVAVGAGSVWVANAIDETVSRIDPQGVRVTDTIEVDGSPDDVAVGEDGLWVSTREVQARSADDDTVDIGILTVCEGVFGFLSEPSVAGGELPLLRRGGRLAGPKPSGGVTGATVAGKPVRLVLGCGDQTAETALAEARRLVEQAGADLVIGPGYIGEGFSVRDYARTRPGVTFVSIAPGHGTTMHDPAPNHFRFNPDGTQLMAGLGAYAYNELGWRTATTVGEDQSFSYTQVAGFVAEFCALGGKILERVWVPPSAPYAPYLAEAGARDADGYAMAGSFATTLAFAKGVPALRGNLSRKIVGGILASNFEGLGSQADRFAGVVFGMGVPGLVGPPSAQQRSWSRYLEAFGKAFPELAVFGPTGFPVSHTNAMEAVLAALERVDGDLTGGQARFRAALSQLELETANGTLHVDANNQVVAPNFLQRLVKAPKGGVTMATLRMVPAVEQSFNGYFRTGDPVIGRDTVECRRHSPPPWTR
jgi:branched-chain amino acid transport system substrate-binding protein